MSDDDDDVFYHNALDGGLLTSAANKRKNALKHFDFFLLSYCKQLKIDPVRACQIPYHGIPEQKSQKDISKWWGNMMGSFITYMGKHATAACKPNAPSIARSATGYSSSVKVFFTDKFRDEIPIPIFQKPHWGNLQQKIKGFTRESTRADGKATVTKDVSSTRQDREAVAMACIWLGTPEMAEFWHLSNQSFHCAGRGSEVSKIRTDGVLTQEKSELLYRYDVLVVELQRYKDGPWQTLPIYPHRDGLLEDFYFSLVHLIVVNGCNHEYVLPLFSKAALHTKKSGESDSRVSNRWTTIFKRVRDTFEILADEINEELGSHSNRRGADQSMVETPGLSGYAPIFRSGLKANNVHTIMDYIFGSEGLLHSAGKALSKWTMKIGETTIGGQPPTFDDIESDIDLLKKFTKVLFEDDTQNRWKPKVRELLAMTLLLRYDQFCDILEQHPFAKLVEVNEHPDSSSDNRFIASTVRDNPFVCRINQALEKLQVDDYMFSSWVAEAKQAFLNRNGPALPIPTFPMYGGTGESFQMDVRCFTDHFNSLASVAQANHMKLQQLQHTLNDVRQAFNTESRITSTFIVEKIINIEKSVRRLEERLPAPTQEPTKPPPLKGVIKFSVSSQSLPKNAPLSEVMTRFFTENFHVGMELDKQSPSWNDPDQWDKQRKQKLSNKLSTIKRAVRMMLMHADAYPTGSKDVIRSVATAAEKKLTTNLGLETKTISIYNLERQLSVASVKEYENSLTLPYELPANTPDYMRKILAPKKK